MSCPRTQCPRLEPGPLAPGTSALTMRSPRLPFFFLFFFVMTRYHVQAAQNKKFFNTFCKQEKPLFHLDCNLKRPRVFEQSLIGLIYSLVNLSISCLSHWCLVPCPRVGDRVGDQCFPSVPIPGHSAFLPAPQFSATFPLAVLCFFFRWVPRIMPRVGFGLVPYVEHDLSTSIACVALVN